MDFGDDDDLDDETFALVDKLVEEHNAKKALIQLQSQVSPIGDRPSTQNGGPAHQMQPAALFPAARPQAEQAPQAPQQRPPLPPGVGGAPVGRITHAAARLRAEAAPEYVSPPPAAAVASGSRHIPSQQPPAQDSLQAQQRLSELEGTNKLLRTNLDYVERDRIALRQRIQHLEAKSGGSGPVQVASMVEMQRQLEQIKQQLLFKTQELEDAKRRAASTRAQDTSAATTSVGAVATGRAAALQPPSEQQQQQKSERIKRRANGTEVPVPPTSITAAAAPQQGAPSAPHAPLFSPSTLSEIVSSISNSFVVSGEPSNESPAAVIARLWASCPESMSTLLTRNTSQSHSTVAITATATSRTTAAAPGGGGGGGSDQELSRLHLLLKDDFSKASAGVMQPFTLLGPLAVYVSRVCCLIDNDNCGQEKETEQHVLSIASAALTIMRYLILNDAFCRHAALLSCGYDTPSHIDDTGENLLTRHSNRIVFKKKPISAASGGLGGCVSGSGNGPFRGGGIDAGIQPLIAQLSRLNTTGCNTGAIYTKRDGHSAATGLQALCINAALLSSNHESSRLLIGVANLAHALVTCAPVGSGTANAGRGRGIFLPLLRSGAILALLRGVPPQQRCRSIQLLHALLEDSQISIEFEAVCAASSTGGAGALDGAAGDTPKTRAAAAREAKLNKKTSATKDNKNKNKINKDMNGDDADGVRGAGEAAVIRSWAGEIMVALSSCLVLVPYKQVNEEDSKTGEDTASEKNNSASINRDGETALARSVLALMALLLEKRCTACFMQIFHLDDTVLRKRSSLGGNSGIYLSGGGGVGIGGSGNGNNNDIAKNTRSTRDGNSNSQSSSNTLTISFPVRLVILAEDSVKYRGDDEDVTLLRTALWPEGRSPAVRAVQSTWQYRLRLAQESLTLLRGVILVEGALANLALEELLLTPQLAQRMLAAAGRMARITATAPPSQIHHSSTSSSSILGEQDHTSASQSEMLFPALPVAPWAYAIGSSSNAASLAPLAAAERRAGLPCCSGNDVSYLARGIRNRILYKLRS